MSTFGKKALIYWNYHDDSKANLMRFYSTSEEIQLQILNKWYPVDGDFYIIRKPIYGGNAILIPCKILGYYKYSCGWNITVIPNGFSTDSTRRPFEIIPTEEFEKFIKREDKLNKLFNGNKKDITEEDSNKE